MRTFPKALATFREIVDERGQGLRMLMFEELKQLATAPPEHLEVESRKATISIIVEPKPNGSLRIVVQGFMDGRLIPSVKSVALDGFYKHPDETITPMANNEFYEFD